MAYTAAKETCSQAELNRFACAFLNCKDINSAIDWDAAAAQFDPAVKTASFRTVTQRAMKKVFAAAEGGDGAEGMKAAGQKGKGGGGVEKKRKAAADEGGAEEGGEEGEEKPGAAKKGRKGRGGKKAKKDEVVKEDSVVDGEEGVGGEGDGEDADKIKTENAGEDELAF